MPYNVNITITVGERQIMHKSIKKFERSILNGLLLQYVSCTALIEYTPLGEVPTVLTDFILSQTISCSRERKRETGAGAGAGAGGGVLSAIRHQFRRFGILRID